MRSRDVSAIELLEQLEDARGTRIGNAVVEHLRLATEGDEAVRPQHGEMLRQRGLAQAHGIDEFADFHLAAGQQETGSADDVHC